MLFVDGNPVSTFDNNRIVHETINPRAFEAFDKLASSSSLEIASQGPTTFASHNHGVTGTVEVPSSGSASLKLDGKDSVPFEYRRPYENATDVEIKVGASPWLKTSELPEKYRTQLSRLWKFKQSSILRA